MFRVLCCFLFNLCRCASKPNQFLPCCCRGRWAEWLLLWARLPICRRCNGCQYDWGCTISVENRSLSTVSIWFSLSRASSGHLQPVVTVVEKQLQDSLQDSGTYHMFWLLLSDSWKQQQQQELLLLLLMLLLLLLLLLLALSSVSVRY